MRTTPTEMLRPSLRPCLRIGLLMGAFALGACAIKTVPVREEAGSQRRLSSYRSATLEVIPEHPSLEKSAEKLREQLCNALTQNTQNSHRLFESVFCDKDEGRLGEIKITLKLSLIAETKHPARPLRAQCSVALSDADTEEALGALQIEEKVPEYPTEEALLSAFKDRTVRYLLRRK